MRLKPVTDYPAVERLDLKACLVLENEFVNGGTMFEAGQSLRYHRFIASGPVLAGSAEALTRAVFTEVQVVYSLSAATGAASRSDVILQPHLPQGNPDASQTWGGVMLSLEWTVSKPDGDLLWKQNFQGQSAQGVWPGTYVQHALQQMFSVSFTNIHQSPAIRALAQ